MSDKYTIIREYNYRITIIDRNDNSLQFRDITGKDLEFLERYLGEEAKEIKFEDVITVIEHISVSPDRIKKLVPKVIKELFDILIREILCNFMPKFKFLEVCYHLQNSSFVALDFFESQPMTKVMAMIQIHQSEVEKINKSRSQST